MLQDKASCLPVAAIDLPTGATVMDACSAPGMKTTQIAASGAAKVGICELRIHNFSEECRLSTYPRTSRSP